MRRFSQVVMFGLVGLLAGCTKPQMTVEVLANGKLMMYVPKGTTVNWIDENSQGVGVTFPYANPCQGGVPNGPATSTCVVETGQAIYNCQGNLCEDPGIGVEPSTGTELKHLLVKSQSRGIAQLYQVFCDANGNATADGPPVQQNADIGFVTTVPMTDFTLSNFNPAVCNPATIKNNTTCTVTMNGPIEATYQVQYSACQNPGTGKLHIAAAQ